eukprot:7236970-Alexandrium_andersonii.AAC.1
MHEFAALAGPQLQTTLFWAWHPQALETRRSWRWALRTCRDRSLIEMELRSLLGFSQAVVQG